MENGGSETASCFLNGPYFAYKQSPQDQMILPVFVSSTYRFPHQFAVHMRKLFMEFIALYKRFFKMNPADLLLTFYWGWSIRWKEASEDLFETFERIRKKKWQVLKIPDLIYYSGFYPLQSCISRPAVQVYLLRTTDFFLKQIITEKTRMYIIR